MRDTEPRITTIGLVADLGDAPVRCAKCRETIDDESYSQIRDRKPMHHDCAEAIYYAWCKRNSVSIGWVRV